MKWTTSPFTLHIKGGVDKPFALSYKELLALKHVEIMESAFQEDHIHLVIIIPPKYSVSEIVGKIKANTSREVRKRFPWVKELYTKNEFWSPGFFSSTVGIDEKVIKRYVQYQEKVDKGQLQLKFDFGI